MISKDYVIDNYSLRGSNITGYHNPWDGNRLVIADILKRYQDDRYEYLFAYFSRREIVSLIIFDFEECKVYEYYCNGPVRKNKEGKFEDTVIIYQLSGDHFENYRKLIMFFKDLPIVPVIDIYQSKFNFYITLVNPKPNDHLDRVVDIDNDEILFIGNRFQYQDHLSFFRFIAKEQGILYTTAYSTIEFDRYNNIRISYKNKVLDQIDPNEENEHVPWDHYIHYGTDLVIHLPENNREKTHLYLDQFYHVIKSVILKGLQNGEEAVKKYLENKVPFLKWFK